MTTALPHPGKLKAAGKALRASVAPLCLFALTLLTLSACKDDDGVEEEFPNWQATNEAYFNSLVAETQQKVAAGDQSWALLTCYSKPDTDYTPVNTDYVVVHKLASGSGTASPFATDSVDISYQGVLLPSLHYPTGMPFSASYEEPFDPIIATPAAFWMGGIVDGLETALLQMHLGDHWKIYVPHQLGYGAAGSTGIPGYSTLIFDVRLEGFWRMEKGDRY